ncbi:hypothetical protein F5I97DRAFT_1934732 [Phlebopus sp. FC_14]|nr:hypothetical protein F5I97DRAFT_1934732 [Phlebopus sp. FC_14]
MSIRSAPEEQSEVPEEHERLLPNDPEHQPMGSEATALKPEGRKGDNTAKAAALVFVVSAWSIVLSNNPTSLGWFAFHPILQSSAIACFTYGILTLQPTSQPQTKAAGLQRHQIAMIGLGFPLILLGTLAMIYNKALHAAPHFTSWHGTLGIIAVVWLFGQVLLGAGSVWFGGAAFGGGAKAKALWKYHRLSGYILFPLLFITAHLAGAWSIWVVGHSVLLVRLVGFTIAPIVVLAGVYTRIRPSKMKFL